jgi:uncharacterized protein (TIGR02466 family)
VKIASMNANEVFRTLIWTVDLAPETHKPLNKKLKQAIEAESAVRESVPLGSNWQTDVDLHRKPAFAEAVDFFNKSAKGAFDFLEIKYDDFIITGCWANIAPRGTKHRVHNHPNNYLSGVYYVQAPEGGDSIEFIDPRPQANIINPDIIRKNHYNSGVLNLEAKAGRLVMFHSYLLHSVPVNLGKRDRISIAFDIMFPRFTEAMSAPKFHGNARAKT